MKLSKNIANGPESSN